MPEFVCGEDELTSSVGSSKFASFLERQIFANFSKISFGNCSIDATWGFGLCVVFEFLYESRPFSGCTARSMPSSRSCFLILHLILGCDATKQ